MIQQNKLTTVREAMNACSEKMFQQIMVHGEQPTLFFYSGGSALQVLPKLGELLLHQPVESQITFCAIDERFDREASNYIQLQKVSNDFYHSMQKLGHKFIDTSPHLTDQYQMATWLGVTLGTFVGSKQIGLLGMGLDGHIAGILPHPQDSVSFDMLYVETQEAVVGFDATNRNEFPLRFSLTLPRLIAIDHLFLYATGSKKAALLETVTKSVDGSVYQYPVLALHQALQIIPAFTTDED